jgi:molybdopterin molybdotransferase
LTPSEAARSILETLHPLPSESAPLAEVDGRVLAADIQSPIDVPPWDNSAMDGFAVRAEDLETGSDGPPATLRVVDEVPAGAPTGGRTVRRGEAMRIFTGAPVPDGADTVIRQEDVSVDGIELHVEDLRDLRRNIRRRGEDIATGATVLRAGTSLGPAEVGLLAAIARASVPVHARPLVAVMASGDEIADVDEADRILAGERIGSSNSYTLAAAIRGAGGSVLPLGIARDDPDDIADRLARIAGRADLLVTSAGMSVGDHDHLRTLLEADGTDTRFWRLRSRPGAPVGFGVLHGVPWIGLPGNPVSTLVTFELFVRPAVRKLGGCRAWFRAPVPVTVGEAIATPGRLQHFVRVTLSPGADRPVAHPTGPQGSGILTSMAAADALLMVPESVDAVDQGTVLPALPLRAPGYTTKVPY